MRLLLQQSQSASAPSLHGESLCLVGRRTSMLSTALTRLFAVSLLVSFLPGAKANCWYDVYVYLSHIPRGFFALNLMTSSPLATSETASEPATD